MSAQTKDVLEKYPSYQATIGIEVHVQLKTKSKIFCGCSNNFGDEPNSNICQVCAGYPGTLPVLNKKVVDFAIMAGLAADCTITPKTDFARKHYMYPDLPKNYQVTQDDNPICQNGHITIELEDGSEKQIRILRMHMEEDAGKNIHTTLGTSLVDLNRAGTPLLEIVSQPDIATAQEARAYLMRLRSIVQYLGISDADMEKGSFRADVNVSVKKKEATQLGTRVEVKNINSFKYIGQAIDYEIERHITMLETGETMRMETRLWDSKNNKTFFMRSKEETADYRYFTEPDLPLIVIDDAWIENLRKQLPELPHHKLARFQKEYGLSGYETAILVDTQERADFFEAAAKAGAPAKPIANWMLRNLLSFLNESKLSLTESPVTPHHLAALVNEIEQGTINNKIAQDVFAEMAATGKMPAIIIEEKDLKQVGSSDELEAIVKKIVEDNPDSVAKLKAGQDRVLGFFVGQVMKATQGKANPVVINELLKKYLG
ncbi:Asp-tRNA(Asn)/Glu-tRNA(Gln) amidotransferase subunit GatB [Candidatus Babeliales bacterium]|nr:Asp-tRNA(Asn)/Glu-tRNA(Gln) amidotransferase subunit GatB [Candidatus Babeliales bacterium]